MTINNRFEQIKQTVRVATNVVRPDKTADAGVSDLLREHFIEASINEKPAFRLACTPNGLAELVLGRIVTEGLIKKRSDVESVYICETGSAAKIYLKQRSEERRVGKEC